MRHVRFAPLALALVLALAACDSVTQAPVPEAELASAATTPVDVILSHGRALDARVLDLAARHGDAVKFFSAEAGFAVVTTADPRAYRGFASTVVRDATISWREPTRDVALEGLGEPPFSGSADFFFDLQWGHTAVGAVAAWDAGQRGAGVKVAVLDGGFDLDHPDLAPNINYADSANFVDGEDLQYGLSDTFSHGTHVAGTIAAASNGYGIIGVAPEAELILVKVLGDAGSGSFADVISGIVHAADVGADVINMSLGATLPKRGFEDDDGTWVGANEVAALLTAIGRATTYAYRQGTTVISSAGNSAIDANAAKDVVSVPSQSPHVISISATAPIGWATDPLNANLDYLASYSNYGLSHIAFAAPGGDYVYPGNENCLIAGLLRPCWVFDLVFSTGNGGWYWSAGTSMASPHAAGIAALIIGEHGGPLHPAQVEAELRARAADLGKPGRDEAYGHGRVHSGY